MFIRTQGTKYAIDEPGRFALPAADGVQPGRPRARTAAPGPQSVATHAFTTRAHY